MPEKSMHRGFYLFICGARNLKKSTDNNSTTNNRRHRPTWNPLQQRAFRVAQREVLVLPSPVFFLAAAVAKCSDIGSCREEARLGILSICMI